jgi:hypothetical protein
VYKPVFHRVHNNPKQRQALCRARLALATFEYEAVSKTPLSFAKRKGYAIGCRGTDCPMACTVRLAQPRRLPSRVSVSKRDAPRATAAAGGGCSDAATQRAAAVRVCGRERGRVSLALAWEGRLAGATTVAGAAHVHEELRQPAAGGHVVLVPHTPARVRCWYPTHQPGSGAGAINRRVLGARELGQGRTIGRAHTRDPSQRSGAPAPAPAPAPTPPWGEWGGSEGERLVSHLEARGEVGVAQLLGEALAQRLARPRVVRQPQVTPDDVLQQPHGRLLRLRAERQRRGGAQQGVNTAEGTGRHARTQSAGLPRMRHRAGWGKIRPARNPSVVNPGGECSRTSICTMEPSTAPTAKNRSAVAQM